MNNSIIKPARRPNCRPASWMRAAVLALLAACPLVFAGTGAAEKMAHTRQQPKGDLGTSAAFAPDGSLWIVGLDADKRLFAQRTRTLDPPRWSDPQVLDTAGEEISADGENRPKIAFGPHGWVVISYTRPLEKPYTGFIRMLRSTDGGRSFSRPFTVHRDRQEIAHRFESIAFDQAGVLRTVWIDKRDQPPKGSGQEYAGAAIYQNASSDAGATFGPDSKLADHSCECCRIALARDREGKLHALWRHVFDEQTRDHAFAALGAPDPQRITRATFDQWQIKACPHHGPGLARAEGAQAQAAYHAVWFGIRNSENAPVAAVRYGRLDAQGRPLEGSVRPLPDSRAEHADVASIGSKVAIVWRSSQGEVTTLKAWLSRDSGKTFDVKVLAQAAGINDHPRLAQNDDRIVVVWRLPQEVQVHEIRF